jgi:hypothetical protein
MICTSASRSPHGLAPSPLDLAPAPGTRLAHRHAFVPRA